MRANISTYYVRPSAYFNIFIDFLNHTNIYDMWAVGEASISRIVSFFDSLSHRLYWHFPVLVFSSGLYWVVITRHGEYFYSPQYLSENPLFQWHLIQSEINPCFVRNHSKLFTPTPVSIIPATSQTTRMEMLKNKT